MRNPISMVVALMSLCSCATSGLLVDARAEGFTDSGQVAISVTVRDRGRVVRVPAVIVADGKPAVDFVGVREVDGARDGVERVVSLAGDVATVTVRSLVGGDVRASDTVTVNVRR